MRNKISIAQHNEILQDIKYAKKELKELEIRLAEAEECIVVDNCPICKGVGTTEEPCDPVLGDSRTTTCQKCKGKGYIE